MTPRVSVLLAVHNGEPFVQRCVASVLEQTFSEFEFVIVDDASTDRTPELIESTGDDRIRLLRNQRKLGQIPSLNLGLREARGEYVARIDHDDVCLPERLELQVKGLDADPALALVSTWYDVIDADGRIWASVRPRVESFVDFLGRIVIDNVQFAHPALMFRRDVVLELGGFDERLGAAEDKDLYRRLALNRHAARAIPQVLVLYRRHEGQMSLTKTAAVRRNDELSHERFLAELAPDAPAVALRMLFWGDEGFWDEPPLREGELEAFVESAAHRLQLQPFDRHAFARMLADRGAETLVGGWSSGPSAYGTRAADVAAFAARHGGSGARTSVRVLPLLRVISVAGPRLALLRRWLRRAIRNPALRRIRHAARRSRILRAFYSKVLGFRLLDD